MSITLNAIFEAVQRLDEQEDEKKHTLNTSLGKRSREDMEAEPEFTVPLEPMFNEFVYHTSKNGKFKMFEYIVDYNIQQLIKEVWQRDDAPHHFLKAVSSKVANHYNNFEQTLEKIDEFIKSNELLKARHVLMNELTKVISEAYVDFSKIRIQLLGKVNAIE